MAIFAAQREFPVAPADLAPAAEHVANHFQAQGYEVQTDRSALGDYYISLHKGGLFKSVLGMKTCLQIELHKGVGTTSARAAIGVWGHQVIPAVIMMFVFWPVLVTQLWGLVTQAKLDDEAIAAVAEGLLRCAAVPVAATGERASFCPQCGAPLPAGALFCPRCGTRVAE